MAIVIFLMEAITKSGDMSTTLGMIRHTVDHQYTHFYANIHMYDKVIKMISFQWRPFWKFKMAVTAPARSRVFISYVILIITNYQCTKFHVNIHMHNKVIEILSFQWRPFWKFKMAVTTAAISCVFISYMILIITNYQYTKFHVNIHMHNKVIEILSFQWRPFWKVKMAVTTVAKSCVFISYMILILKNY